MKKSMNPIDQKKIEAHIKDCANAVGDFQTLAKIVKTNETTLRRWRRGEVHMKAITAMKFEIAVNEHIQKTDIEDFLCDRKLLLSWFFPHHELCMCLDCLATE